MVGLHQNFVVNVKTTSLLFLKIEMKFGAQLEV